MLQLQLLLLIQLLQLLHGLLLQAAIQKSSQWEVIPVTYVCKVQPSLPKCSVPPPVTSADKPVRHRRVWLPFCLPLSLQLMEITTKPESLNSSHAVGNNSEEINETLKILCASFYSQSNLQTYFRHTQYLLSDLGCPLVREYKLSCTPKDKDLSIVYFQGSTITEYWSTCLLPETKSMAIMCPDIEFSPDPASTSPNQNRTLC